MDHLGKKIILTGPKNSGKTTVCSNVVGRIKKYPIEVKGIISPGTYQFNHKTGISSLDISTLKKRQIACHVPGWDTDNPEREWKFIPQALEWANNILGNSVPTDLLIIDEIGFLELEKNTGWTNAIKALESGKYHLALVVVRPTLCHKISSLFPNSGIYEIDKSSLLDEVAGNIINAFLNIPGIYTPQSQMQH